MLVYFCASESRRANDHAGGYGGALSYLGYLVNTGGPAQIAAARDCIVNYWRPSLIRFDSEALGIGFSSRNFWVVHGFPEIIFEE